MSGAIVTLLTDFGLADGYVGAMKGVLLARTGGCFVVDLSHEVPHGDIDHGSFVLAQAAPWYPPGTVHVAVVDPGVGSARRAIAAEIEAAVYVAPDNGVLTDVLQRATPQRVHLIETERFAPEDRSPVFHGRDVFAPAAAHLACRGSWADLGRRIEPDTLVRRPRAQPSRSGNAWLGTIVHVDRFGNLVTNVALEREPAGGVVELGGTTASLHRTYSDVASGALLAVRGSSGLLEIAVRDGSAARRLGITRGDVIRWRPLEGR